MTPLLSLALALLGPFGLILAPLPGAGLVVLAGAAAVLRDGVAPGATAALTALAAGAALDRARRLGVARVWLLGLWCAVATAPAWAAALTGGLAAPGASAPPGFAWFVWPGAALAGPHWDPLRHPALYESWGSVRALPQVSPALYVGALVVLAGGLYSLARSRQSGSQPKEIA